MAVNYGTKNVNSDTVGWTRLDVLNALEEVFTELGFHGGTAKTGVPVCALWPGQTTEEEPVSYWNGMNSFVENYDWMHCGGTLSNNANRAERKFEVTANGTTSYYVQETWQPTDINVASDTLTVPYNDVLTTGTELKFIPSGGDATNVIGGLQLNTSYWVIRVSTTEIKLAADANDAGTSTAITLTGAPSAGWGSTTKFFKPQSGSANQAITTYQGDQLIFNVDATGFHICSGSSYDGNKTLELANAANLPYAPGSGGYLTDNGTTTVTFETAYWIQSEDNTNVQSYDKPSSLSEGNAHQGHHTGAVVGQTGTAACRVVEYCYANDTNATMKASITILPKYTSQAQHFDPYWDVDIAGTVGGAAAEKVLKLRVSRYHYGRNWQYRGRVKSVHVLNTTDGWSGTPTFTISGTDIGGVTPGNDVKFGTNTDESAADVGDGTCSLVFTDYGAGTSFYQKSATGDYAVLKLVHDASKEWGTTYWLFVPSQTNPYQFNRVSAGAYWETLNCWGTTATPSNISRNSYDWHGLYGFMDGIYGGNAHWDAYADPYSTSNYYWRASFATSSQPTDYKLRLKYWKPVSPMDDSYAVIQFLQVVNDAPTEYFTFSLPPNGWGVTSPGVDLDHLYHGHIVVYSEGWSGSVPERSIDVTLQIPAYDYSTNHPGQEPATGSSIPMESSYGYVRNKGSAWAYAKDRWACNIATANDYNYNGILQYYRNHNYDNTNSAMDYYRPIKGIPLLNCFAPCPYYLPDDFVMIQIASTPGLTAYTTGDTITISGSEKYEIIKAHVQNSTEGLDGVSSGSTIGMAFCARIVG